MRRLRPLGIAVGEVVDLGQALDGEVARSHGMVVSLDTPDGELRLAGNPIRIDGVQPTYRMPPRLHEHIDDLIPRGDGAP